MAKYLNSRIGILGGSFDPAHKGHLKISKIAIKKIKLKKVFWVITKRSPFKKKTFFSLKERIDLSNDMVENTRTIEVLYLDDIIKSSRSIDIINYLSKKKKLKNLYFIIGSDILINFHKWKNWKKIVKIVKLIVFSRKGYDRKGKESIVVKYLNKNKITFIKNKSIQISSTILRKKINKNS